MLQIPLWKRVLILAIILAGIVFALPNVFYNRVEGHNDALAALTKNGAQTDAQKEAQAGWPDWMPSELVNLGLDLRGGAQLLAQVNVADVYKSRVDSLWPEFRKALSEQRSTLGAIRRIKADPGVLRIRIGNADQMQKALQIAETLNNPVSSLTGVGQKTLSITVQNDQLVIQLSDAEKAATDDRTLQQSLEIVRRRIDAAGTREPTIVREGGDRILIQVPGLKSAQELKQLIGTTAKLTFNSVISTTSNPNATVSPGQEVLPSSDQKGLYYVLDSTPVVSGEDLTDARPDTDQNGYPAVAFRFNVSAARTFGDYTQANIGKPFAIVLDNKVISAPTIQSHIAGGSGIITGRFTVKEATDLALLLRAGALPASMTFLEERTIGPELGADSIRAGKLAAVVGAVAVVGFMIASYGLFGFFASLALGINIALIFAIMSLIGGTLTLPGIAGIVLTMGTAVDANVLVFERIREELRNTKKGKAARAIELGYERAMSAIVDANVTTFLTAVILFVLGAGPVRGFAVTFLIGIITSVFTAIWVTRLFVTIWFARKRPKELNL
ncbi:preprotein translocase subunit SecD [Thioclava dalianensis]|uniref:Protein translocase subunit SecD n=1 Tax=Thioclava dalianensis TaxID=1185766 RepID=A0A074UA27_9RHOB|nr:protein translocase subunit SecD [Thioclava dalianensis]KEP71557.1 preprotein translocase subunit SecD [Thioclava dalianensis]SFN44723.1 preprotein translocase subunit SecD [Thioclava dalianensis]